MLLFSFRVFCRKRNPFCISSSYLKVPHSLCLKFIYFFPKFFFCFQQIIPLNPCQPLFIKKQKIFFFCFLLFLLSAKAEMEFLYLAVSAHPGFPKMPDSSYNLLSKTHIYTILSFGQSKTLNSLFIVDDT